MWCVSICSNTFILPISSFTMSEDAILVNAATVRESIST